MRIYFFVIAILMLTSSFEVESISNRLCKDNEEIVFSFLLTKTNKVVSLCKDKNENYLVYRFGTKDKVELEYPKAFDANSWNAFNFYGVKRFGGKANAGFGDYSISFVNNNVKYKIFESWNDENNAPAEIGVSVIVNKKEIILNGDTKSKIGSLLRLDDESDKIKNTAEE